MYKISKVVLAVAVLLVIMTAGAAAQAPNTLMYQGKLTDASLDAITDSTDVIFRIWDANSDDETAVELWAEALKVGPNDQGVFSIELGAETPFPLGTFDGSVRYLGIEIVGDEDGEMTPRQPITSAPYSLQSNVPGLATSGSVSSIAIGTSVTVLRTLNVVIPAPGYLVLEASGFVEMARNATYTTSVVLGISEESNTVPWEASAYCYELAGSGYTYDNFCVRMVRQVEPGPATYYLTGDAGSNTTYANLWYSTFTATFIPASIAMPVVMAKPEMGEQILPAVLRNNEESK